MTDEDGAPAAEKEAVAVAGVFAGVWLMSG